jgi:hypothetical protein
VQVSKIVGCQKLCDRRKMQFPHGLMRRRGGTNANSGSGVPEANPSNVFLVLRSK